MMWVARTGAPWWHLPDEYGRWNSVFRRYRRRMETGVFDALLETLAEIVARNTSVGIIDSGGPSVALCGRSKKGSRDPRAWSVERRLDHQAPSPLRWTWLTPRLFPDAGQGHSMQGFGPLSAYPAT